MIDPSDEWQDSAADLCPWAQEEGFPAFVILGLENNDARYIGPRYPASLVVSLLRTLADEYEKQVPNDPTLN